MTKVKVLHIITRFLKGGTEKNVLYSIQALDDNKYYSELIIGKDSDINLIPNGIKVFKVNSLVRSNNPIKNLKAVFDIYKILRSRKYHIIHTHQANAGMTGRIAARLAGVPVIVHGLHGSTFHPAQNPLVRKFYIMLERMASKFTTCFTCVGHDLRDRYLREKVGKKEDYHIIRSGIELENFYSAGKLLKEETSTKRKELGVNANDTIVGVIAALEPRKGHIYIIEVVERLQKSKNLKFLFVGGGWYREKLEKLAVDKGLSNRIIFTGHSENIAEIIAACDIIALTSLWEGLPQILVQSAAVGKPMISFAVEGANEVIREGVNGFIVPIKDVKAFEEKLRYLIENPEKAKEMGRAGKEMISEEWEIPKMQEKVREFYGRLVEEYL